MAEFKTKEEYEKWKAEKIISAGEKIPAIEKQNISPIRSQLPQWLKVTMTIFIAIILLRLLGAILPANSPFLASVFPLLLVGAIIFFIIKSRRTNDQNRARSTQQCLIETKEYFEVIQATGIVPSIETHLLLNPDERAHLQNRVRLCELRSVRKFTAVGGATRIMKGVYAGAKTGQSESRDELRVIAQGNLVLTNKRIVFEGGNNARELQIKKMLSIDESNVGIRLSMEGKGKSITFLDIPNPYLWKSLISYFKKITT